MEIYLGATLVGCKGLDGAGPDGRVERWAAVADARAGLALWQEWMSSAPRSVRCRIWLGSTLARPWVLPAACGAKNAKEAAALAALSAADLTGQSGDLQVWTAPWRANRPTLAVAMPRPLWEALAQGESPRVEIESVRPWWNQLMNQVLERSRAAADTHRWTLAEPDGHLHGQVRRGDILDAGFDGPKKQDPGWALLRRRLAVGWEDGGTATRPIEHFDFLYPSARSTHSTPSPDSMPFAIGGARSMGIAKGLA